MEERTCGAAVGLQRNMKNVITRKIIVKVSFPGQLNTDIF